MVVSWQSLIIVGRMLGELERSAILEGVCERYSIPVIPTDLLEQYGSTFGETVGTQFDDPE
jgi:hypothetical protein